MQAKLDLASVLEESAAAGKKASEAKTVLEAAQSELRETKMRLESEEAANAGLKAAVMEANEVNKKTCCRYLPYLICLPIVHVKMLFFLFI